MKLISYNVNGLRAALEKDKSGKRNTGNSNSLLQLIDEHDPDILAIQECKCDQDFDPHLPFPYKFILSASTKKGYSGVAIFSKIEPMKVLKDFPENQEGRVLCLEFSKFYLLNTYTPNSKQDLSRLDYRVKTWEPLIRDYVNKLQEKKPVIFSSDFNVAPTEIDIYSTKGKERAHGFTIEERTAFKELLTHCKLIDTFRHLHPTVRKYSWFSYFNKKARENNNGWKIDAWLVSKKLHNKVKVADILNDYHMSDHCPVTLEIDI
jgi:exodeoxyribonuclease-3